MMKIKEVREIIKRYSREELHLLISEMYKLTPKKVIEEKNIEALIQDPKTFVSRRKTKKRVVELPDIEEIKWEAEEFIEHAREQYYFAPNQIIPKKDRPKWRFIVKRFYKDLVLASQDPEALPMVAEILEKLYELLQEASRVYLFNTSDPFRSVGITEEEFYRQVVATRKQADSSGDWIKSAIRLLVNNARYTENELIQILFEFLNTQPLRDKAIKESEEIRREPLTGKKDWFSKYQLEYRNNNLTEIVFRILAEREEYAEAASYFKQKYSAANDEVLYYNLLRRLMDYQQHGLWVKEYETAIKRGIKPRAEFVNMYQQFREGSEESDD